MSAFRVSHLVLVKGSMMMVEAIPKKTKEVMEIFMTWILVYFETLC
jgi:hypothetical protein